MDGPLLALGMDVPSERMGPHGPSGWIILAFGMEVLGMNGVPWALEMDGPWEGMGPQYGWALGMAGCPWVLGIDRP